jgi:hypothetical protein
VLGCAQFSHKATSGVVLAANELLPGCLASLRCTCQQPTSTPRTYILAVALIPDYLCEAWTSEKRDGTFGELQPLTHVIDLGVVQEYLVLAPDVGDVVVEVNHVLWHSLHELGFTTEDHH